MDNGSDPGEIRDTMMKVEIDANSGFCGGVIRAIKAAETSSPITEAGCILSGQ